MLTDLNGNPNRAHPEVGEAEDSVQLDCGEKPLRAFVFCEPCSAHHIV